MIVMKFGGTSVGDGPRIRNAAELIRQACGRGPVVVVSALSGVTDRLIQVLQAAERRDEEALQASLEWLRARHERVIDELALPPALDAQARAMAGAELAAIGDAARGVFLLGERTPRTADRVMAAGELISHRLMALALATLGVESWAADPRELMPTDDRHGGAIPDLDGLAERTRSQLAPLVARGIVPVTGGFVGATAEGRVTTLGRGGSDFSASLIGAAAGAEEVQIWTDVPGMMTADPRVVPGARTLSRVSFDEAAELAYFGAKVLHPATIRPAVRRGIPVRILDATQPEHRGTLIDGDGEPGDEPHVRAVAWKRGITTISMDSPRMLGAHGFLARVFAVFERHETPVDVVTTSEVSVSVTVDGSRRLEDIRRDLEGFCHVEVTGGSALVCLVGRRMLESPRLLSDVLASVHPAPLTMFCLGASDINLTLVVSEPHAEDVVRRLHARFLEGP